MAKWCPLLLVLVAFAALGVETAPATTSATATQSYIFEDVLSKVDENERREFLKFYLQRGYALTQQRGGFPKTETKLSDEQAIELFQYFLKNHLVANDPPIDEMKKIVCWENIGCVDVDDPGVHP